MHSSASLYACKMLGPRSHFWYVTNDDHTPHSENRAGTVAYLLNDGESQMKHVVMPKMASVVCVARRFPL